MSKVDIFREVKARVSITDAFRLYGIPLNRRNEALCVFHNEKTPSLVAYTKNNSFYCFGCHVGGSVIDLAIKLFGLERLEAAKKLDIDFGLNLYGRELTDAEKAKYQALGKEQEAEQAYRQWQEDYIYYLSTNINLYHELIRLTCPSEHNGEFRDDFREAINEVQYLEYLWDILYDGTESEKASLYLEKRAVQL